MKSICRSLLLLALAVALVAPALAQARVPRASGAATRVVLDVNGIQTTAGEIQTQLDREWQEFVKRNQGRMPETAPQWTQVKNRMTLQIVEKMIERHILLSAARRANVRVPADSVTAEWNEMIGAYPTEAEFDALLAASKRTRAELRKLLEEELQIREFLRRNVSDAPVAEAEIQAFYQANRERFAQPESVRASHILVPDAPDAQATLRTIKSRLDRGEDFAKLAGEFSTCPSKAQGGDLGEFGRGQMVPEFEEVAFTQALNRVSAPVKTQFGWHLILVKERQSGRTPEFAEVRERIAEVITNRRNEEEIQALANRLRLEASIKVNGPIN